MKRFWLLLFALLTLCGCASKPSPTTYHNVGHVVSSQQCPGSWGFETTTRVVTDKGFFVVYDTVSAMIGDPVRLGSDGVLYIGSDKSYELCN